MHHPLGGDGLPSPQRLPLEQQRLPPSRPQQIQQPQAADAAAKNGNLRRVRPSQAPPSTRGKPPLYKANRRLPLCNPQSGVYDTQIGDIETRARIAPCRPST